MTPALHGAGRHRHQFVGAAGYGIAYGSHPAGSASARSDLDLVLIRSEPLLAEEVEALVDAVRALHHEHGLALDTEVDYAVKAHATCADVADAVGLRCFALDDVGRLLVRPVVVEPWFLNSEEFRLRLLLNALTSPHTFLGGDIALYRDHRRRAERAVALLALVLHGTSVITLVDAMAAVSDHSSGARGKDFLGYSHSPHLYSTLAGGLAELAADGVVEDIDGQVFQYTRAALAAELRQLRAHIVTERGH